MIPGNTVKMRNIKEYLKKMGVTQKKLAERLDLSRPTLDAYIQLYENGDTIPKEKYAVVFDNLFAEECSAEEFENKVSNLSNLLIRDYMLGVSDLSMAESDFIADIIKKIRADIGSENWDRDVYLFINSLINSYRDNELLYQTVEYFLFINGIKSLSEIKTSQKAYFANLHKSYYQLMNEPELYNDSDYILFEKRCKEIEEIKENKAELQKKRIKNKLEKIIEESKRDGIELTDEELFERLRKL